MTMLITAEQARAHLRIEGTDDADDLALKTEAAEQLAAEFLNRQLFTDQQALDTAVVAGTAGEAPMVVNSLIRAGILLVLGHLYENREDVITGTAADLPQGSRSLLAPYRVGMGV